MKTSTLATRGLLAAVLLAAAQLASAHAIPKVQQPGPGAKVSAPHEVTIEFTEALEPTFSAMYVTTESGTQVTTHKSTIDLDDKKMMRVSLPDLQPGVYTVQWKAFAADGHRTQGHYNFTIK
nr:copper resistance protein CopC [Candidatus Burkholderia verschuerenii]